MANPYDPTEEYYRNAYPDVAQTLYDRRQQAGQQAGQVIPSRHGGGP